MFPTKAAKLSRAAKAAFRAAKGSAVMLDAEDVVVPESATHSHMPFSWYVEDLGVVVMGCFSGGQFWTRTSAEVNR